MQTPYYSAKGLPQGANAMRLFCAVLTVLPDFPQFVFENCLYATETKVDTPCSNRIVYEFG
jgi:hypothetical protein